MAYYLTQAGANRLNAILAGMELPNPTGSSEFGGNYTPTNEDFLLFAIGEKSGSRASREWLLRRSGYYDKNCLFNLLSKGYITTKKQT